jgi:hypothetical protein
MTNQPMTKLWAGHWESCFGERVIHQVVAITVASYVEPGSARRATGKVSVGRVGESLGK